MKKEEQGRAREVVVTTERAIERMTVTGKMITEGTSAKTNTTSEISSDEGGETHLKGKTIPIQAGGKGKQSEKPCALAS